MGLFETLRDGALGVELAFPPAVVPSDETDTSFQFVGGPRAEIGWWLFSFPNVSLDLSDAGWPTLKRDIDRQTRALFEQMFRGHDMTPEARARGPRTNDPTWSPLVEAERISIDGGSALYVLHRMTYQPGSEILMGHLLIPCAQGLVETRWVTTARVTGMRETVWTARKMQASSVEAAFEHPGQAVFDDPALDADFPDHPLSIAREARRWLAKEVRVRVLRSAARTERTESELPAVGYALVPPPRFAEPVTLGRGRGRSWARWSRASFSGSDGVDWFFLCAFPAPLLLKWRSPERRLATEVEKTARRVYSLNDAKNIKSQVVTSGRADGRPSVSLIVDGEGHLEPLRMAALGTVREGQIVTLFLMTSATLPNDDMFAELGAAAQTLRPLEA
ncbi:MAG TPA: hypothetical protein VIF57_10260 [Polyangia bacterium]|jgi:hypothetical protein